MTFDALAMHAIRDELEAELLGGHVEKVVPLSALEVGLRVRSKHRDFNLLMSADPQSARVHLVGGTLRRLSEEVSPFLLLMRKYVREGRIVSVQQPPLERVIRLGVEKRQEDGSTTTSELIIEAMGRHSNVILVGPGGQVLDALKRVPPSLSRQRPVLPHLPYSPPPPVEKLNPFSPLLDHQLASAARQADPSQPLWRFLQEGVSGLGPLAAREVVYRTSVGKVPPVETVGLREEPSMPREESRGTDTRPFETGGTKHEPAVQRDSSRGVEIARITVGQITSWPSVVQALGSLLRPLQTHQWSPCVVVQEGAVVHFAPYLLTHFPEAQVERVGSMGEAVERAHAEKLRLRPAEALRAPLRAALEVRLDRARRREESLRHAMARGEKAEDLKLRGQAILASVAQIAPGQTELEWDGVAIALDPHLSPADNAQRSFKEYTKARDAAREIPALLESARLDREYLEQMLALVEAAQDEVDLRAISRELAEAADRRREPAPTRGAVGSGSRRRPAPGGKTAKGKAEPPAGAFKRFTSGDGLALLVGGSARGNERVTFDLATGEDLWLHARGIPGAHVIVKSAGREVPRATLLEAARLAALHSQARGSAKVPVDYALQRYVKKIKGAPPGLVTYSQEKTLRVDGSETGDGGRGPGDGVRG